MKYSINEGKRGIISVVINGISEIYINKIIKLLQVDEITIVCENKQTVQGSKYNRTVCSNKEELCQNYNLLNRRDISNLLFVDGDIKELDDKVLLNYLNDLVIRFFIDVAIFENETHILINSKAYSDNLIELIREKFK